MVECRGLGAESGGKVERLGGSKNEPKNCPLHHGFTSSPQLR